MGHPPKAKVSPVKGKASASETHVSRIQKKPNLLSFDMQTSSSNMLTRSSARKLGIDPSEPLSVIQQLQKTYVMRKRSSEVCHGSNPIGIETHEIREQSSVSRVSPRLSEKRKGEQVAKQEVEVPDGGIHVSEKEETLPQVTSVKRRRQIILP